VVQDENVVLILHPLGTLRTQDKALRHQPGELIHPEGCDLLADILPLHVAGLDALHVESPILVEHLSQAQESRLDGGNVLQVEATTADRRRLTTAGASRVRSLRSAVRGHFCGELAQDVTLADTQGADQQSVPALDDILL